MATPDHHTKGPILVPRDLSMFNHPCAIIRATPPPPNALPGVDLAVMEKLVPGCLAYGQPHGKDSSAWRLTKSEIRPDAPREEYRFTVPLHGAWLVAARLENLGLAYDVEVRNGSMHPWRDEDREARATQGRVDVQAMEDRRVLKSGLTELLAPYQHANVSFGSDRPYLYNIWPCGSGKTLGALVTALAKLRALGQPGGRILVVCPGKARATWEREVRKRTNLIPFRKRPAGQSKKGDVTFKEYQEDGAWGVARVGREPRVYIYGAESVPLHLDEIAEINPTVLIVDELHLFGNRKRWDAETDIKGNVNFTPKRSKGGSRVALSAAGGIISRIGSIRLAIGLSATPLDDGRPRRLWSQFDMLSSGSFSFSYYNFADRYCDASPGTYGGIDDKGASNLRELTRRCSFFTHEVSYSESHGALPPTRVDVEFLARSEQRRAGRYSDEETYLQAQRRLAKAAAGGKVPRHSVVEARLAEACSRKRHFVVEEAISGLRGGGKVLIFATRIREVEELTDALHRELAAGESAINRKGQPVVCPVLMAHGGVSERERDHMVAQYRDSPGPIVMVATGDTMGTSVDGFQTTTLALLAMLPWKPGDFTQWRGRFDRLGGTATLLKVIVAEGTFDERVIEILTDKLGPIEIMLKDETVTAVKDQLLGIDDEEAVLAAMIDQLI